MSASTVSRELRRNKSHCVYSYSLADEMSRERRERLPGNRKIPSAIEKEALRLLVEEDWSPMQISGYLKRKGIRSPMRPSIDVYVRTLVVSLLPIVVTR